MAEEIIHFNNRREAQDLTAGGPEFLRLIAGAFDIRITARDMWVKLSGPDERVQQAAEFFRILRDIRERGARLGEHGLRYALRAYQQGKGEELRQLYSVRIDVAPGRPPIFPRTFGQRDYVRAIMTRDITFGIGPAGTGKTYLAMAMAVSYLLKGDVSRIILTRPAIEAGEALGYLPGDMYQKVFPYLRPLYDALYDMMSPDDIERNMDRGVIEVAPLAYMRGRTLNHAFVILDEAQNTTSEQMLMFLTRLGFDSRCVITGDLTQVDLPPSKASGLVEARRILSNIQGIAFAELTDADVVRHSLVQKVIQAYREDRLQTRGRTPARPTDTLEPTA
ncbi:MAG TPA: PhoH family protein [Lentisphaerae bacterium]|nr:MAG: PhoH family protein [Verrucomicrobiota bacterium]HDL77240.1 PhoH family protein [Lentisphaerota bacterium]